MSLLSSPLRDRFGNILRLNFYDQDDIKKIVERSARILDMSVDAESAVEVAKRSRRTPRVANRLLKRVRDFSQVRGDGTLTLDITRKALHLLEVDEFGLDEIDRRILEAIIQKFQGGPVGLSTLAAATAEEIATIEDIYEPFLMQIGFLHRTPRGRVATELAYEHLGFSVPDSLQNKLL